MKKTLPVSGQKCHKNVTVLLRQSHLTIDHTDCRNLVHVCLFQVLLDREPAIHQQVEDRIECVALEAGFLGGREHVAPAKIDCPTLFAD